MTSTTVAQFAAELKMPADVLLEQLNSAGVNKSSKEDEVTEADKGRLLASLRKAHGDAPGDKKKITLTRRKTTELKQAGPGGRARTVQVEVRKKTRFPCKKKMHPANRWPLKYPFRRALTLLNRHGAM
ncbi:MAG: hypothetical protein HC848_11175 [Limnobacter sp.]|nr:hypothetical protein [Limnobacter sp.]